MNNLAQNPIGDNTAQNTIATSGQIDWQTITGQPALTGTEAFKAFITTLQPKNSSREIWVKYGHDRFIKAQWTDEGFTGRRTKLTDRNNPQSREVYGNPIDLEWLARECRKNEGGAFYIPTQPQGFPLAECVDSTDDLAVEIDDESISGQWELYQEFTQITGLEWALILTSGGKSLHGHLKAIEHLSLEQAQYVRRLLILAMMSDPVTVRLHQPMRIPGFHRLEKDSDQVLLSHSTDRHSYDELVLGLRVWFEYKGLAFPFAITDRWWLEFHHALAGQTTDKATKFAKVKTLLETGLDAFEANLAKEKAERQARKEQAIANLSDCLPGVSPVEQVQRVCAALGDTAFDWPGHQWKDGRGKARGCCPFHDSKSGNSAWIAPGNDGKWNFHCSGCGDDKPIDAYTYWWSLKRGYGAKLPTGKASIEAMRDFCQHYGYTFQEEYRKAAGRPKLKDRPQPPEKDEIHPLTEWDNRSHKLKLKAASEIAEYIADRWDGKILYDDSVQTFWRYGATTDGLWTERSSPLIRQEIIEVLDETGVGYGDIVLTIERLLQAKVASEEWTERKGVTPFINGILRNDTGAIEPHSPDNRLRWQLPYSYNPLAQCQPVIDWLSFTQNGDEDRVQLLRAYLKAIVMGRTDLQRFMEVVATVGGSGKSTFCNMAIGLVGFQNVHITTSHRLETSRFETTYFKNKRLVYFADAGQYSGQKAIEMLKRMTGNDLLPFERKGKDALAPFTCSAMVLIAANAPLKTSDTGIPRRRITVPFDRGVEVADQEALFHLNTDLKTITGKLAEYLPGVLNWVLALSDEEMTRYLKDTDRAVPGLAEARIDTLIASNHLASWVEERCIVDEKLSAQVGSAKKLRVTQGTNSDGITDSASWDEYTNKDEWLYANYRDYCDRSSISKPISLRQFAESLENLLRDQMGYKFVSRGKNRNTAKIDGVAIRNEQTIGQTPITKQDIEPVISPPAPAPQPAEQAPAPPRGFKIGQPIAVKSSQKHGTLIAVVWPLPGELTSDPKAIVRFEEKKGTSVRELWFGEIRTAS